MVLAVDVCGRPETADRWSPWLYLLIFLAGIFFFIGIDLIDGDPFNGDIDDAMRAVQIRILLDTGSWFDMSIPSVGMPEKYLSPWSRLVDLPYALIAGFGKPILGQERALKLAFQAWPLIMAAIYGLLAILILQRVVPERRDLPVSVLLVVLFSSTYAIWEFSPGRIDHHNVQILLLLGMVYGIARWDMPGGLISGVAVSAAVAVGLETLPLIACFLVTVVAAWSLGARQSARFLKSLGLATALSASALMALLLPPSEYFLARPDSFSAPYAGALVGFGVLAAAIPALMSREDRRIEGVLLFAVLGLAVLVSIGWLYGELIDGPFPMITGLTEIYWFDRINQEKPVTFFFQIGNYSAITLLALMLGTVVLAFPEVCRAACNGRAALPVIFSLLVAAIIMTLTYNRTFRLAAAVVPLLMPVAIAGVRQALANRAMAPGGSGTIAGALVGVVGGFLSLFLLVPKGVPDFDAYDFLLMNECKEADFSVFGRLGSIHIMTPPALGLQIISRNFDGVAVSTVPFHRASPGIQELLATFRSETATERAMYLRNFDYLAICKAQAGLPAEDQLPLFADLLAERKVEGLIPVPDTGGILLFRIDRTAMRQSAADLR